MDVEIAVECVASVYRNKEIFSQISAITDDLIDIVLYWNSMKSELLNIAGDCDINTSKLSFLSDSEFTFTQTQIQEAECANEILAVIKDCIAVAGIEDDPIAGLEGLYHLIGDGEGAYNQCKQYA